MQRPMTSRLHFLAATTALLALLASCNLLASSNTDTSQDPKLAIVDKYVDATHIQQAALRGAQMEVDIDAKLIRLEKQGRLKALRKISRLGQITYKALGFSGDNTVKQEVITRYLAAESEGRDNGTIAITPANYKFRYAGRIVQNGRTLQVLDVTPRKKIVGLFKGELWIDSDTGMPVRESGQFVKNPSVFLKKIAFVRDYELHDGVAFPSYIESTVDTRIVGRAQLQIHFVNYAREDDAGDGTGADSLSASGMDASGGATAVVLNGQ
jgi:hypothetical protein